MKAHLQANAQMVVDQLHPLSHMDFGYTQASVEWLEGYIERLRVSGQFKDEKMKNQLAGMFGSFLGETVIRNYGGDWVQHDGASCVAFDNDNVVFPLSKTRKQMDNGLEDGIGSFFRGIAVLYKDVLPPSS